MTKQCLIIGMGMSGQAAYRFVKAKGRGVVGIDQNVEKVQQLCGAGFQVIHDRDQVEWSEFDLVVVSPGVPDIHPWIVRARQLGIETIGEAELAFREASQRCVAVTGTNGKTTVVLLIEHILKSCGKKARALGNIGKSLTDYFLNPDPEEIIVAELSSYQLETMTAKVFDAGVILNITPDHLDRYPSMELYAQAKCRLQFCMKPQADFYVYSEVQKEFGHLLSSGYRTFGCRAAAELWTDKSMVFDRETVEWFLPLQYKDGAIHDSLNLIAAWAICRALGVTGQQFESGLQGFKKPSHRIEFVSDINGVRFFDDSKGTNIDAVVQAIGAMNGPVILIAGGVDKGGSYSSWKEAFSGKVKQVIVLGQAAEKIKAELGNRFEIQTVTSMEIAVELAHKLAEKGDCVLLSPGCASFDMFRDYAHRGEVFKSCVHHLERR